MDSFPVYDSSLSRYGAVKELSNQFRRKGSTTYLLKAALQDPDVIIMSRYKGETRRMREEYKRIKDELPDYLKHNLPEGDPLFATIGDNLQGINLPIVFDNSTFI